MAIGKEVLTDAVKYGCDAGNKCWLRQGVEYCAICHRGDRKGWEARTGKLHDELTIRKQFEKAAPRTIAQANEKEP